jgi:hypothetical protein
MNLNDDHDFIPSLQLLPFGGFEVAPLIAKLKSGKHNHDFNEDASEFPLTNNPVSSGWLQSKIITG